MQVAQFITWIFFIYVLCLPSCITRSATVHSEESLPGQDPFLATWEHPPFIDYSPTKGARLTPEAIERFARPTLFQHEEVGTPLRLKQFLASRTPHKEAKMVRVPARVLLADYTLLRKDFPFLKEQTDEEIDQWLVEQFAWMAFSQTELGPPRGVQTPTKVIPGQVRTGLRPFRYGRALIVPAFPVSPQDSTVTISSTPTDTLLLDLKGAGAHSPIRAGQESHGTGLMSQAEAIREFAYEKLVSAIFDSQSKETRQSHMSSYGLEPTVLPNYAVLGLNFRVYAPPGLQMPAALLLRRSHIRLGHFTNIAGNIMGLTWNRRSTIKRSEPSVEFKIQVEKKLREYGLTSTGQHKTSNTKETYDQVNLQVTRNFELLDFGAYKVKDSFSHPFVVDRPWLNDYYHGGHFQDHTSHWLKAVEPTSPDFVQPGSNRVSTAHWGMNPTPYPNLVQVDKFSLAAMWLGELDMIGQAPRKLYESLLCVKLKPEIEKINRARLPKLSFLQNCKEEGSFLQKMKLGVQKLLKK